MKLLRALRTQVMAVALALFIAAFFALHVLHFQHRNDAEREVWTRLPLWQILEAFEYRLYDARFSARGVEKPKSQDRIVIVGVDENSLAGLPSWPIPRALHAKMVRRLKAAGARVIALDFDFSQPQNPRDDAELEKALEETRNALVISYLTPERKRAPSGQEIGLLYRTTTPLERFDQWTPDIALAYLPIDSDGRARRYPFHTIINDANVGSLGALCAAAYQNFLDDNANKKYEEFLETHRWPALDKAVHPIPVSASRGRTVKSDAPLIFSTPIHFYGPQATFTTYSYLDVLEGNDRGFSAGEMKEKFSDKIVLVGPATHILKDMFVVPDFSSSHETRDINQIPGVEIHATATAMLLDGVYIRTQSTRAALWTLFLFTIGASLWAASLQKFVSGTSRRAQVLWTQWKLPGEIHTPLWFSLYLFLSALPVIAFWLLCQKYFVEYNFWIIEAYPLLSASIAIGIVLLFLFGVENSDRQKTETIFARAASPELMAKILASGEDLLRPENKCVTCLFSDLEGFTTYSESHSPQQVIEVTNDFLSSVVPIIHKYDGWVDKYIGDAIMAVFGAIVERPDHADAALRCAVEMQDAAAAWRKRTGINFYMRVGIHTGDVIAGYMGSRESKESRERMDYTVIGDTVNLASRLEGKNKEFDSWIMCSAQTFEAAPDVVAAKSVSAPIKGKSKEVAVFIVHGLKDDPERDKNWAKDVS